jgi:glutaredoxin-dependent peroxiredoxin
MRTFLLFIVINLKICIKDLNDMKIEVGKQAPDFSLHDTEKKPVSLNELKGNNVLLLFFPLAFTSICTKELCSVRDNIGMYNNAHAKVFGISVDSPQTLAKFKEEQHLNFPLLSDFNKEASKSFGCLYEIFSGWMHGVSKRSAFVIDRNGVIQYAEVLEKASDVPDFNAINKILSSLDD